MRRAWVPFAAIPLFAAGLSAQESGLPQTTTTTAPAAAAPSAARPKYVWWPSRTVPRGEPYRPLTNSERAGQFFRGSLLNPNSYLRASLVAGINHWQNDPSDWGSNLDGFEKRLGDSYARFALRDGIESVWAGVIHHEPRYIPCECAGFGPRLRHVFLGAFRTYNSEGKWRPHYSRYGSAFAAEFIRYTWRPPNSRDASELATGVALQLSVNGAGRFWREFSPDIYRAILPRFGKKKFDYPLPSSAPKPAPAPAEK